MRRREANYTIVYPPTLDWDWMKQRPQHVMERLAALGFRVIFCNKTQRRAPFLEELGPNLLLCHNFTRLIGTRLDNVIIYTSWAMHHTLFGHWRALLNVFDNVDEFREWEKCEELIAGKADLVITASRHLFHKWRRRHSRVYLVPNGCDFAHFRQARTGGLWVPPDLAAIRSPIAGYVGALGAWVDTRLLQEVATAYPHVSFVFVGPLFGATLPKKPNCHFLGLKPYAHLPAYMSRFDVCLVPFRLNSITRAANPIKVYEYAAAGLPIVSTRLPELVPYRRHMFLARSRTDFVRYVGKALRGEMPAASPERLAALARAHTWERRARRIRDIILRALASRTGPPTIRPQ